MKGIYLDYAATTPVDPEVIEVISQAMRDDFGNASSLYKIGRESKQKLESVRRQIADTLNASADDIIITSGGTESNDSAINQTVARLSEQGKHLITTAAEHSSVYQTMRHLETLGFEVTYLGFDEEGHINFDELVDSLRSDTILVSIMAGNNEVGSLQDIQAIGDLLNERDIFFHTDTVQTYLNIPLDVEKMHIDALSMSAHKIFGPKGIGFMYYRNAKADFSPYVRGGNQENKHRAGTEALPLILGMSKAIEKQYVQMDKHQAHLKALRQYFLDGAKARGLNFKINGPLQAELAHVLNIYWPGHASDQVLIKLDLRDAYLSAGSACTAGSLEPSRVLISMYGVDSPRVHESLRISFGDPTDFSDIDQILDIFASIN
ncbi:cysteine desulfurase [Aerococcus viridans]|uniref:cysteine desulfurase n=1 Tax=Aerococcus viridans TaxID=1377 RepID=A0A2N6UCH2_9LACT|nr:cysteine desulfurase family protein [Aerococcus viridans]PMC79236.1 cysteine desulfurase [Aerococcus viridans]